jgi:hypothetical protein
MIGRKIREWDRNEAFRRRLKVVRNLFIEPPPRNRELVFRSYSYTYPEIHFVFEVDGKTYTSKAFVADLSEQEIAVVDPQLWGRALVALGMTMAPFHFLLADFASVRLECAPLTVEAEEFYQEYFRAGLAELRYRQGLNPNRSIRVYSSSTQSAVTPVTVQAKDKILMLNGGGKDTAVMAELLLGTGFALAWGSINLKSQQTGVIEASGIKESYAVGFKIDSEIEKAARYPWGHVPRLALFICLGLLPAIVKGFRFIATGNEYSANFGNTCFRGVEINHQYSKSHGYESAFNSFLENSVVRGVSIFSALRPFYDIRIAAMLSRSTHYLDSFISCNKGAYWCRNCPKCAFTFLALAPFMKLERLISIFGENLFESRSIRLYLLDLLAGRIKPWECVGTQEECQLVMALVLEKYPDMDFLEFPQRADLAEACSEVSLSKLRRKYLVDMYTPHNIPDTIYQSVKEKAERLTPV